LQYLRCIAGLSPLRSALALLPLPAVLIPLARNSRIAERFGINQVVALGLTLSATGMLVLTTLDVRLVYWHLVVGLVLFAAGMGLAGTPATTAVVSSLPASEQGVASAVDDTSRELGSARGIAILGTVLNSGYRSGLADALVGLLHAVAERVEPSVSFVSLGADRLEQFGPAGADLVVVARQSFVDATGVAFVTAAGVLPLAAVFVALRAPRDGELEPVSGPAPSATAGPDGAVGTGESERGQKGAAGSDDVDLPIMPADGRSRATLPTALGAPVTQSLGGQASARRGHGQRFLAPASPSPVRRNYRRRSSVSQPRSELTTARRWPPPSRRRCRRGRMLRRW